MPDIPTRTAGARRRRRRRHLRRGAGLILAIALAVVATSCAAAGAGSDVASLGDGDGTGTTGTTQPEGSTDPVEAGRQYAACMREHGIDMPDPKQDSNGGMVIDAHGGGSAPGAGGGDQLGEADRACRHFLAGVTNNGRNKMDPEEQARMKDQALAFSKCMREHGVDMPDPVFSDDGGMTVAIGGPAGSAGTGAPDPDSPAFKEAEQACESLMPKPADGTGEGPSVQTDDGDAGSGARSGSGANSSGGAG